MRPIPVVQPVMTATFPSCRWSSRTTRSNRPFPPASSNLNMDAGPRSAWRSPPLDGSRSLALCPSPTTGISLRLTDRPSPPPGFDVHRRAVMAGILRQFEFCWSSGKLCGFLGRTAWPPQEVGAECRPCPTRAVNVTYPYLSLRGLSISHRKEPKPFRKRIGNLLQPRDPTCQHSTTILSEPCCGFDLDSILPEVRSSMSAPADQSKSPVPMQQVRYRFNFCFMKVPETSECIPLLRLFWAGLHCLSLNCKRMMN